MNTKATILTNKKGEQYTKINRRCVICGKQLNITLKTNDGSYRGGHFFFDRHPKNPSAEYWECPPCYWFGCKNEKKCIKIGLV